MRWYRHLRLAAVVAAIGAFVGACAPTDDSESWRAVDPPTAADALNMALLDASDSVAVADGLARTLAIALNSPATRRQVRGYLLQSEVRERKLHLQRFLRHAGTGLEATLAEQAGIGSGRWADLADRLVDLELYMPVKAQWEAWDGEADVIVAAVVEKDEAYAARGGAVRRL